MSNDIIIMRSHIKRENIMFKIWKNQMKNVPSWQYKNNLITSCISCGIITIAFVSMSIYYFAKYSNSNVWWVGFIPLAIMIGIIPIYIFGIKWLWKNYKIALLREQKETKIKHSLQDENE